MKIGLISSDQRLYELCREILVDLGGAHCEINLGLSFGTPCKADLYIWDVETVLSIPEKLDFHEEQRHLFLVPRKELLAFRDRLPMAAVAVLLKPVNPVALRSFLEHALARCEAVESARRAEAPGGVPDDRDAVVQRLVEANLRLQEYDQDRTIFLARAVHDFRAPLTAISGYCGLLLSQQLGPLDSGQVEVLAQMQHSTARLMRLADAMFHLSAGRNVELRPCLQEASIEACIEHALHEIAPRAIEKNIHVSACVDAPGQPLRFDPSQIEQVLVNLLDNACKFTPRNGSIEVRGQPAVWERCRAPLRATNDSSERLGSASSPPNAYRVEVADNGPGVPADSLKQVFGEQVPYGGSQDRTGGGLGLAICKMILQAHGGSVLVESNGTGATFGFLLPFDPAASSLADSRMSRGVSSGAVLTSH